MIYLLLPIGLAFPTLIGWLTLRLTEGSSPVLYVWERWIAGYVLGCVLTTFVIFLTEVTGIGNFSLLSMLIVQLLLLAVLGSLYRKKSPSLTPSPNMPALNLSSTQQLIAGIVGVWILAKLVSMFIFLIGPAYYDDVVSNWNMRGKAFFVQQELVLDIDKGIAAYPQSVPLVKTWLANLAGTWHEGLVNAPHFLWYLSALALVFFALCRRTSGLWATVGTYVLASVPLYAMHGAVAYADCFLSVVIFLCVSWMYFAATSKEKQQLSYLKISAIAAALLIFTKNEALLLHLPPVILLLGCLMMFRTLKGRARMTAMLWYGASVAAVLIPWVLFKWINSLNFGNAKEVSGLAIEWHGEVLPAIFTNTFHEGNWAILPGVFFALLILRFRHAFRTTLVIPVAFVCMVILGQLPIYMFTSLYVEAINQTGYARGIIHLIPLIVVITTMLLRGLVTKDD